VWCSALEDGDDVVFANDEPIGSGDLHVGSYGFPEEEVVANDCRVTKNWQTSLLDGFVPRGGPPAPLQYVVWIFMWSTTSVTPGAAQAAFAASSIDCHDEAFPVSVTLLPEVSM
jgi:hypothetical protein